MKAPTLTELPSTKEIMAERLGTLREYARKMVLHGGTLTLDEATDQEDSMRQFLTAGQTHQLTYNEMVRLVLEELFQQKKECGCHSCKTKAGAEE